MILTSLINDRNAEVKEVTNETTIIKRESTNNWDALSVSFLFFQADAFCTCLKVRGNTVNRAGIMICNLC